MGSSLPVRLEERGPHPLSKGAGLSLYSKAKEPMNWPELTLGVVPDVIDYVILPDTGDRERDVVLTLLIGQQLEWHGSPVPMSEN